MTWLWIPHASSWSSTYECVGLLRTFHPLLTSRFTFQHLPTLSFVCFVFLFGFFVFVVFWFLFCKCLGIPNSPRSLDLDDRQGLIARSAMQQKKKKRKFFDNVGQSDHTQDSQYQGKHWWWVLQRFQANQYFMARRLTISEPWGFGSWQANMVEFEDTLRLERAELDSCEEARKANHQYRTSHGTYRIKRTQ